MDRELVEKLSDADKDALIERLWHDLQAERSRSSELEDRLSQIGTTPSADNGGDSLLSKLRRARAGAARSQNAITRPPSFLRSRILQGAVLFFAVGFALDAAIGRLQSYWMDQKRAAALALQHSAYKGLYVELVNIAGEPDGKSYRLTLRMSNVEPGRSLYVMQAPVRAFLQSGLAWKEIPARAPDG